MPALYSAESARAVWFEGFDRWQAGFNKLLAAIAAGRDHVTEGKAFLRDVMVPWKDEAKDRLLREVAKDVLATCEKAIKLDTLVNKENV